MTAIAMIRCLRVLGIAALATVGIVCPLAAAAT
jgi:hypothetical protein